MKPYTIEDKKAEHINVRHLPPNMRKAIAKKKKQARRDKRKLDRAKLKEEYKEILYRPYE